MYLKIVLVFKRMFANPRQFQECKKMFTNLETYIHKFKIVHEFKRCARVKKIFTNFKNQIRKIKINKKERGEKKKKRTKKENEKRKKNRRKKTNEKKPIQERFLPKTGGK